MKDLVVLAADKDLKFALKGLLSRPQALGISGISCDIFVEPGHDPACLLRGVDFLDNFASQYGHALLIFDHEGCGRENTAPDAIQEELNGRFESEPWNARARALVLHPELEAWVWSDSPHVDDIAGWKDKLPPLRDWLIDEGFLNSGDIKPRRPKEAFKAALRKARKPPSASLYKMLAEKVSVQRCTDSAFHQLLGILREWFAKD